MVRVWDVPVRVFHGLLAASVAVAWVTAGEPRALELHLAAGWVAAALVGFRLVWAFVARGHAALAGLAWPPRDVWTHARALVRGDAPRHLGHNPVAGWAMLAGLGLIVAMAGTGLVVLGGEEGRGLLAGRVGVGTGIAWHDVHEALGWGILAWIGVHLAGVAKESLRTRENLPGAMVTGRKRGDGADAPAYGPVGLALAGIAVVFAGAYAATPAAPATEMPDDATWRKECGDCHLAYHPSLLPARSWARMMDEQGEHFGEDLMLDPKTAETVRRFLLTQSADAGLTETAWRVAHAVPGDEAPQRITDLPFWKDVHAEVAPAAFETAGGKGRCDACHGDAEKGAFEDGAIELPKETNG